MTKRSLWCDFDKETRKYIKKRDKDACVICGSKGALQIMHVFLSRAKGGKGCKENGCLGCVRCHNIYDNPIGQKQKEQSIMIDHECKKYLIEKENIVFDINFINSLKFNKNKVVSERNTIDSTFIPKSVKHCRDCVYMVKNRYNNSTIPTYYCKLQKILVSKNNKTCYKFKER